MSVIADRLGKKSRGRAWQCAAALSATAVAGCVHYHAQPLEPARSAQEFAARQLTPSREWNRAELLALALRQNPQLAVARAEVKAALSREISAAQAPNPDMTLQSEYARHDAHPWLYGVSFNWLLRSSEQRRLGVEMARLDTSNARLQLMDHAWAVRRTLAAALSEWETTRRRARLLDRLAHTQDRLIELEARRVKIGEDAPSELIAGRQGRIQIELEQAELHALAGAAQASAAAAMGVPSAALDGLRFAWPDWGDPPPVDESREREAREQALLSRADLGAAIGDYAGAEAKLQLAVARQYPQFTLSPGYYWDHGIAKFPLDVGFTLPLNRNRGEIAEARAGRELAGQRMLALQAEIYGEVAAAEREEHIARESSNAAERRLAGTRQQLQQADLALRVGAMDAQGQVGAQIIATQAEMEALLMRARLQTARNNLEDALRAPLSGPEVALGAGS
ncbi:MAG TPA: TolC family protein [Steroidobacteraceae bacterium]|nr:TolC family protein [Steroidobacteraceae bacterium]